MRQFGVILLLGALTGCVSSGVQQVGAGKCKGHLRHGPYKLRIVDGPVVVSGDFVKGKKHGLFTFYTAGGTKVAEIPYRHDEKNGTIRLWYTELAFPGAAGRPKLDAEYKSNLENGKKQSWWPSGSIRSIESFRNGSLLQAEAWDETGASLSRSEAEELATKSAEADTEYYRTLESEVDAHPPLCVYSPGWNLDTVLGY
jgi:hypothetical protein